MLRLVAQCLEVGLFVELLETDFEHSDNLLLIVDVENWVVHDMLEGLVGHRVHLLDRASFDLLRSLAH